MKILPYTLLATLSIISQSVANDTFNMDVATLKEQALNKTHEKIQDGFLLLDIDGNGKLSRRECSGSGSTEALKSSPFFSQEELATLIKKIDQAFDTFDKDKNGYLDPTEGQEYISHVENLGIDMQMKKMDKNGDGEINADEMTHFMQSMPSLEESMSKLQELTKKMNEINPREYADNLISNIGTNINKEEFSEMDKKQNGQVTKEEYTSYMFNHPNNKGLGFSEDDYNNMFDLIDTDKKGYITEQQYIDYNQNQLKDVMSDAEDKDIVLDVDEKDSVPDTKENDVTLEAEEKDVTSDISNIKE